MSKHKKIFLNGYLWLELLSYWLVIVGAIFIKYRLCKAKTCWQVFNCLINNVLENIPTFGTQRV
jgi:hypothetical protein